MEKARQTIIMSQGRRNAASQTFLPGQEVPREVAAVAAPGVVGPAPAVPTLPERGNRKIQTPPTSSGKGLASAVTGPNTPPREGQAPDESAKPVATPSGEAKEPTTKPVVKELPGTRSDVLKMRKGDALQLCIDLGIKGVEEESKLADIQARLISELGIKA